MTNSCEGCHNSSALNQSWFLNAFLEELYLEGDMPDNELPLQGPFSPTKKEGACGAGPKVWKTSCFMLPAHNIISYVIWR